MSRKKDKPEAPVQPGGRIVAVAQQKGGSGKTTVAANLAIALHLRGVQVQMIDTDPQGSLGRWFMERLERMGEAEGLEFATSSAWGAGYEGEKARKRGAVVIIDTPPKIDADLRPTLRAADLVVVPVGASLVDLWATDGVLDLARREKKEALIVLNRVRPGTRLSAEVAEAAQELGADVATTALGHRVAFAASLGQGASVSDPGQAGPARDEVDALTDEILDRLGL